jgi:hypothetical protein
MTTKSKNGCASRIPTSAKPGQIWGTRLVEGDGVLTSADIPEMQCVFVQYPDLHLNDYGVRGDLDDCSGLRSRIPRIRSG